MFTMFGLILGQIAGNQVLSALLMLIILGVVFWLLWWLVDYIGLPQPFDKVARVILAIAAVILLINTLLSMIGKPLIVW